MTLETSGSTSTITLTGAQELSVQAKVEQIAGAIAQAHRVLDQVHPQDNAVSKNAGAGLHDDLQALDLEARAILSRLTALFGDPSTSTPTLQG